MSDVPPPSGASLARALREIAREAESLARHCDTATLDAEAAWRAERACVESKAQLHRVHVNTRSTR